MMNIRKIDVFFARPQHKCNFLSHWAASKPSCLSFTSGWFPYRKFALDPENLILIGREKPHAFVFIS